MHRRPILDLIDQYQVQFPEEVETADRIKQFVIDHDDCFHRTQLSGHITGSAWIVNPEQNKALFTHHKKLNKWLQLGGHADGDADVQNVAWREAEEESGIEDIALLQLEIFDIDIHQIPARGDEPAHYHYDCRFLFQAASETFVVSDESHDLAWLSDKDLMSLTSEESVLRMMRKFNALL